MKNLLILAIVFILMYDTSNPFTVATVYHAVETQTDSTPLITASGYVISDPYNPPNIAAVPRNLIYDGTVSYGDLVEVECGGCEIQGVYQIQDIMNERYNGSSMIDLLVPPHIYGKWDINSKLIRR